MIQQLILQEMSVNPCTQDLVAPHPHKTLAFSLGPGNRVKIGLYLERIQMTERS